MVYNQEARSQILRQFRGRARIHLHGWNGDQREELESHLLRVPGIHNASASRLTRNIQISFDPERLSIEQVCSVVGRHLEQLGCVNQENETSRPQSSVVGAALVGVVGHGLFDTIFYAVAFAGPLGPSFAALAGLHLTIDLAAWGATLAPAAWLLVRRPAQPELSPAAVGQR